MRCRQVRHPVGGGLRRSQRYARQGGFTLIEAALTTVIIGTGVLAIVAAQQAYHMKNEWATRTGTAMLLANEIRELTMNMPIHDPITGSSHYGPESNEYKTLDNGATEPDPTLFDDLDDFAGPVNSNFVGEGTTISPPINALRMQVSDLDQWSQVIRVQKVMEGDINSTIEFGFNDSSSVVRVETDILYLQPGNETPDVITTLKWIVTR